MTGRGHGAGKRICTGLLLLLCLAGTAKASVVILPLGDSITHGGDGDGGVLYPSYRFWLYQELVDDGYVVDFVGSLETPVLSDGVDPDNEGHPGYTAGEVLAALPAWLEEYPAPDVALIHLGTNDAIQGTPVSETVADLRGIIAALRSRNPSVTILVAQIIPTSVASTNERIEALNAEIAGLVDLSSGHSPVVVVDMYTGYDGDADNQEGGVHPVISGEKKMAAAWRSALVPALKETATAAPTTTVPAMIATAAPMGATTVQTVTATLATATPTPTASRLGARTYRLAASLSQRRTGTSIATGSGSSGTRITVSNATSSPSPPSKLFVRWYPSARWGEVLR